jgi:putative peptide zinc metalloprotease protein
LSVADRVGVLRGVPWLAPIAERLAVSLDEVSVAAGTELVSEGDPADRLFVVVSGRAEVSISGRRGPVALALVGAGEVFGEMALLSPDSRRTATVTALEPTLMLSLEADVFTALLETDAAARAAFEAHVEQLFTARFIQLVAPFAGLDDAGRRWLADRVSRRSFGPGEVIIRQGEAGDSCFILRSGQAEVFTEDEIGEHMRAKIGPNALFGESAVLGAAPRSASVRAVEACELLELDRAALAEAVERWGALRTRFVAVMRSRERPRRAEDVIVGERSTTDGDAITVLKHPGRMAYYRLSSRGRFVWERLDGSQSIRDLTLAYMREFGELAPQVVGDLMSGLAAAGFVTVQSLAPEFTAPDAQPSRLRQLGHVMVGALQWRVELRHLDRPVSAVYDKAVRYLFTRPAQIAMAIVSAVGVVLFIALSGEASQTLRHGHRALTALVILGYVVVVLVHESGHAFTTKAFGREVHKAGFGWYWFAPVFFVDTSDMWLGSRGQRVIVSLAGPYATLVLGGLMMIVAVWLPATALAVVWSLALPVYLTVLLNLDPMLEYDGYYVVSDLLDRPNLRQQALARIRLVLRQPSAARGHWVDVGYGVAAIVYIGFMSVITVLVYRTLVERWVAGVLPAAVAADLTWVVALLVVVIAVAALSSEMRDASASVGR